MSAVLNASDLSSPGRQGPSLRFDRVDSAVAHTSVNVFARRLLSVTETDDIASPGLLHPARSVTELWLGHAPVRRAQQGCLDFTTDGQLLFGTAVVDESTFEGGLSEAASHAYAAIFALLQRSGCPHLLRIWNYMARINVPTDGLERYRQFNIGRQQAFLAAGRSAFTGSPAACALGTVRGPLTIHFLAGQSEPRAVENPRQVSAYNYPAEYGPRTPTFSRAALADLGGGTEALFISGTASIVGHATLHAGDVRRQTLETLDNIDAVVASAVRQSRMPTDGAHRSDLLECTVYVRREADLPAIREAFEQRLGADSHAARRAVYLRADICRSDLLVEIEAHRIGVTSAA
jgi:chorismate lyase/3-hydroxybenzoate synthase